MNQDQEQQRLDQHHRTCREAQHTIWGRAIASAGWEWDSYPIYKLVKEYDNEDEECHVILWHATTGRMIDTVVVENCFLGQRLLDVICGVNIKDNELTNG